MYIEYIYVTTQLQKSFFEKNKKHKFSKGKSELLKEIECFQCVRSLYFVIIYLHPLFFVFGFFKNLFSSPLIICLDMIHYSYEFFCFLFYKVIMESYKIIADHMSKRHIYKIAFFKNDLKQQYIGKKTKIRHSVGKKKNIL